MSILTVPSAYERSFAVAANRVFGWVSRHWLLLVNLLFGVYIGLPWLAPVLMKIGTPWGASAGKAIYLIYSTQCHQLPERSFFVFGPKLMYPLADIQAAWYDTDNPLLLRQFLGNPQMGWKVAWSDRMVALYGGIFIGGLIYGLRRKHWKSWPVRVLVGFTLPMVVDGVTHLLSDFAGLGRGFRDSNAWLAALTRHAFPATFYAGDALGSFNSWMRLITGLLFGLGVVWLAYPYLAQAFADDAPQIKAPIQAAESGR